MHTVVSAIGYVLYLCIESSQTCGIARYKVIAPEGSYYADYSFGERVDCLSQAAELSKVTPDIGGHYFLAPDVWYECRGEKAEDALKRPERCQPDYKVCE